ncbi:MAG: hypothetical protein HYX47_13140 [Burkholderiales bacterium]|nr:hypothetical protein [Burkholderiales bacterium]
MANALLSRAGQLARRAPGGLFRLVLRLCGVEARRREREAALEAALVLRRATITPQGVDTSQMRESQIFPFQVTDRSGVPIGTLKIWYDAQTRVAKRELTIVNKLLADALASPRLPLEPRRLPSVDSMATLREVSLREVEEILGRKFGREHAGRAAPAPAATQPTPMAPPVPIAPRERAVPARAVRSKAAYVQQVDEGVVQDWGLDQRTIPDSDNPGGGMRKIEHYFVDVQLTNGDNPGSIKRVWGSDLERAVAAASPQRGDQIRISHLGRQQIPGGEGDKRKRYMNMYDIELMMGGKR